MAARGEEAVSCLPPVTMVTEIPVYNCQRGLGLLKALPPVTTVTEIPVYSVQLTSLKTIMGTAEVQGITEIP